ncbi:MFS transporter [Oharaeibacter diazotrophicus]|uniref:Fucose permease n=2 Tax=Oharaeibacter diazotrophicus TaxID=1920512 RepID=A0A4R6RFP1_9HYPH|nr:MFS transporter [Oharaeibacter diazotrophicus]TDP85159.1 fucose permease [Oharaeibacter diazotrophicus]BBE74129.1 inner membrane protein YbjJ [Pleomorphomonas sp. SM30]GLS76183.1 MFS transporter [Oharaeibacter diazotrophicus]
MPLSPLVRARVGVAAIFLVNGMLLGSWAPQVPIVKTRLGLSDLELSAALLAMAIGAVVTMPFTSPLVARFGSAPVTRISAAAMALGLPLAALAPSYAFLLPACLLFGGGMGLSDVGMNTQAVEVETAWRRPIMSGLHAMFSVGGFLAAGAGGLALALTSPTVHALAAAAVALAIVALAGPMLLPGRPEGHGHGGLALPTGPVLVLSLLTFATFMAEGAMLDWTAVWLHEDRGASPALAAAGYSAFACGMAIGRFSGDAVRARTSAVPLVAVGAALAALALAAAVALAEPVAAIAALGVAGLGLSNVVPVLFTAAGKAPGQTAAGGVAAVATTGYLGILAGPPVIGWIAEHAGLSAAFAGLSAGCLAVALSARAAAPADRT